MTRTYYVKITERIEEDELRGLISRVSETRRVEALKKRRMEDRIQGIVSELFIKYVLQKTFGINLYELQIFRGKYGKPFANVPIQFNISHSKNIILASFSDSSEIGIDIEEIKPISIPTLKSIFLQEEYEYVQNQEGQEQQLKMFYKFWTLKESYIKYLGTGLYRDMNTFGFTLNNGITLKDLLNPFYKDKVQFMTGKIENYYYSLCCKKEEDIQKFEYIEMEQILYKI